MLGQLLAVEESVESQNYGIARDYATAFFDAAAKEETTTPVVALRDAIRLAMGQRDAVTGGLATASGQVAIPLKDVERALRKSLDYPVSSGG